MLYGIGFTTFYTLYMQNSDSSLDIGTPNCQRNPHILATGRSNIDFSTQAKKSWIPTDQAPTAHPMEEWSKQNGRARLQLYHLSNDTTLGLWRGVSRLTLFKQMGKRTHDRRQQAIYVAHVAFELYTSFTRESHLIPQVRDVCLLEYPDEQNSSRNQMWTAKGED